MLTYLFPGERQKTYLGLIANQLTLQMTH